MKNRSIIFNKRPLVSLITVLAFAGIVFESCDKEEDDPVTPAANEYIADDNSFADFENWTLETTLFGEDPGLGAAHKGNDSTAVRKVYFMNGQDPANGEYPVGTLVAKRSTSDSGLDEIVGMAKRGNNFDAAGGNWEYFVLDSDGKIMRDGDGMEMRGADLMGGMCQSCHVKATTDYVFTK